MRVSEDMSFSNTICKACKDKFHYCSSCGIDGYSEYGFCSSECLDKGDNYINKWRAIVRRFCKSLNKAQFAAFIRINENVNDYLLDRWIEELK